MPTETPNGIAMTDEIKMIKILPTKAFAIPPPCFPTGFGRFTKKLQLIAEIPSLNIRKSISNKGNVHIAVNKMMIALNTLFLMLRYLIFLSIIKLKMFNNASANYVDYHRHYK